MTFVTAISAVPNGKSVSFKKNSNWMDWMDSHIFSYAKLATSDWRDSEQQHSNTNHRFLMDFSWRRSDVTNSLHCVHPCAVIGYFLLLDMEWSVFLKNHSQTNHEYDMRLQHIYTVSAVQCSVASSLFMFCTRQEHHCSYCSSFGHPSTSQQVYQYWYQ